MSQIFKKLDKSSKVLFLIAVVGIVASLYSLYHVTSQTEDAREAKDKIATVTIYNNDTRLKRSGSIHWFPVNQPLDCYPSDLVFTGKDSFATIQFLDGGKIKLHPMSLISLSAGHISLSSGTIEVDLKKGPLSVESFGETFKLDQNTKLRLENTDTVKRIVPLDGSAGALENDSRYKEFLKSQTITLTNPTSGQQVPKFDGKSVVFNWKSSQAIKNDFYRLEFSQSKSFAPVLHSAETTTTTTKVPSVRLPAGIIHWRVSTVKGKVLSESSFYHSDKFKIERLHPINLAAYPFKEVATKGLLFEWSNPLKGPQRIQISKNKEFTEILQQGEVSGVQKVFNIDSEGSYFWRVGYVLESDSIHWSDPGSFTVDPDVIVAPLELVDLPAEMDFATKDSYLVKVRDLNNCDQFEFTLTKGDKVVFKTLTASSELKVNRLKDGNYRLSVTGKLKQKYLTEPAIQPFEVKTSPPLQAPKIKNKKNVKLFVRLLRKAAGWLLSSAHAAEQFYRLEWEGEADATYEVEVSTSNKKVISKEETKEPNYKFFVPGLNTYFWRVRMKKKTRWSPWSEYSVVETDDKIKTVTPALMVSPEDGETVETPEKEPSLVFKWNEPDPNFTYYLELSNKAGGTPIKVISVKGGEYDLRLAKLPKELYWRVYAKSKYENTSISSVRYLLKIDKIKEIIIPPAKFILRAAAFQSQSSFVLDKKIAGLIAVKDTTSLAGQIVEVNLEYLPGRWFHAKGLNFILRKSLLAEGDSSLDETKLGAEILLGQDPEKAITHNFYLGYYFNLYKLDFGGGTGADFSLGYLTGRYLYRKNISERFSYQLGLGTQVTLNFLPSFTFRPGVSFKISPSFLVDVYGLYERYSAKPKFEGKDISETGTFLIQNTAAGAGITYIF